LTSGASQPPRQSTAFTKTNLLLRVSVISTAFKSFTAPLNKYTLLDGHKRQNSDESDSGIRETWYEQSRLTPPRTLDRLKPQQEAVGTAASVVGLIGSAITLIQQIRSARDRVKDAPNTLTGLSKQLESLERSLSLVREEEVLQTAAVEQQVRCITEVAKELQSFLGMLAVEQRKRSTSRLVHAIKSGDKEDRQLADILDRLDRARDLLVLQISVAQVGVIGNLNDGFRVTFGVLMETNDKVNEMLGINLVLAERLKDRAMQQTGIVPNSRPSAYENTS
jgi:uncharacterized protein YoxC